MMSIIAYRLWILSLVYMFEAVVVWTMELCVVTKTMMIFINEVIVRLPFIIVVRRFLI